MLEWTTPNAVQHVKPKFARSWKCGAQWFKMRLASSGMAMAVKMGRSRLPVFSVGVCSEQRMKGAWPC